MDSAAKKARGSDPNEKPVSAKPVTYNVNKLSRELLIRVFGWLPFHQRHETIPLVCRKWAELTSVPCKSMRDWGPSLLPVSVCILHGKSDEHIDCPLQALSGSTHV